MTSRSTARRRLPRSTHPTAIEPRPGVRSATANTPDQTPLRRSRRLSTTPQDIAVRLNFDSPPRTPLNQVRRRRVILLTPPTATCSCKAPRCADEGCMECSLCCRHAKKRDPPGRPKRQTQRAHRLLRAAQSVAYVDPPTPISISTPQQQPNTSYAELVSFLRIQGSVPKKLISIEERCDPSFWHPATASSPHHQKRCEKVAAVYRAMLGSIARIVCGEAHKVSLDWFYESMKQSQSANKLLDQLGTALAATKKGSQERRVLRVSLCSAFTQKQLDEASKTIPALKIGHTTYAKSRPDKDVLKINGRLDNARRSRQRFDQIKVDVAIRWILSFENVSYLSWGTKSIHLDGSKHDVPSILRKKNIELIYREYKDAHSARPSGEVEATASSTPPPASTAPPTTSTVPPTVTTASSKLVSCASFFRLAKTLTDGELQARTSVDSYQI